VRSTGISLVLLILTTVTKQMDRKNLIHQNQGVERKMIIEAQADESI
jgi:hypothetical protein